jgi:putative membrane protein
VSEPQASAAGAEWRRVHPLSPLLRAGRTVLVVVAVTLDASTEIVLDSDPVVLLLVLAGALVVAATYSWLAWRATAYRIGLDELELRSGILFRSHRRVPTARIESIDVARPIVARILGLAQVRVEAVSQGKSEVRLSYLTDDDANAARDELAARQRGALPQADPAAPPNLIQPIVRIPTKELAVFLVGARTAFLAVLVLVATLVTAAVSGSSAIGVAFVGGTMVVAVAIAGLVEGEKLYGFTLGEGDDALHIRRGMLNELHQRVSPDRIQAVGIVEPWLWRPFNRVQVVVDIAGYRGGEREQQRATTVLLPLAPPDVATYVLERIVPGLALHGLQFAHPPRAARLRAPVRWRAYGAAWTERHAVVRRGVLRRHTDVVPHHKVQSLRVTDGPWQRRLGLATLHLDTAGTNLHPRARHFARTEAERLAWASRTAGP